MYHCGHAPSQKSEPDCDCVEENNSKGSLACQWVQLNPRKSKQAAAHTSLTPAD